MQQASLCNISASSQYRRVSWQCIIASVQEHVPEADDKLVFDTFHIAQHPADAVDRVRRKENRTLRASGDDRLAGTRYDWLRNPAGWSARSAGRSASGERAA